MENGGHIGCGVWWCGVIVGVLGITKSQGRLKSTLFAVGFLGPNRRNPFVFSQESEPKELFERTVKRGWYDAHRGVRCFSPSRRRKGGGGRSHEAKTPSGLHEEAVFDDRGTPVTEINSETLAP